MTHADCRAWSTRGCWNSRGSWPVRPGRRARGWVLSLEQAAEGLLGSLEEPVLSLEEGKVTIHSVSTAACFKAPRQSAAPRAAIPLLQNYIKLSVIIRHARRKDNDDNGSKITSYPGLRPQLCEGALQVGLAGVGGEGGEVAGIQDRKWHGAPGVELQVAQRQQRGGPQQLLQTPLDQGGETADLHQVQVPVHQVHHRGAPWGSHRNSMAC